MSPIQSAVRQAVAASPAGWSEEDIRQAVRIGERLSILYAEHAAGQDRTEAIATVSASAKNIAAASVQGSGKVIYQSIIGAIADVASKALIAAL